MKRNFKLRLALIAVLTVTLALIAGGCGGSETPPKEDDVPAEVRGLILTYLSDIQETIGAGDVYFARDEPAEPQDGDFRIDHIEYAGERLLYETYGVAYEVESSRYWFTRMDADDEGSLDWHTGEPMYVVLSRSGYDDSWQGVIGKTDYIDPDRTIDEIVIQVTYGIWDIDTSITFDGYPQYVGLGSGVIPLNEEPTRTLMGNYEPIYNDGDAWWLFEYRDLSALCYYNSYDDVYRISSLTTTRSDVETHRGIRMGASRAEVLAAYPEINDTSYWDFEGDFLWYGNREHGFGAALLFYFEDDAVVKIRLIDMFD